MKEKLEKFEDLENQLETQKHKCGQLKKENDSLKKKATSTEKENQKLQE